ncbi:MAG: mechanosensitive ion channel family protein [Bacteroidales bacterium]|nr:mechanosensitive ion channel family protein [Bacteroidales bacterium]
MTDIISKVSSFLTGHFEIGAHAAELVGNAMAITAIIFAGIGINWICQLIFKWLSRHNIRLIRSKWHPYLIKRKIGHNILMIIPGLVMYALPYLFYADDEGIIRVLHRADIIFMLIVMIRVANGILLAFLDFYSTTEKNRSHPLQGLVQGIQVVLYFIGGIMIVAILIDKSPAVLLTGLGASAAVLMLVFKDSILGFVAGVQLSQNDMIRLGDWIQMNDGSANGTVEEITLNTVKVRNWDNTISMIPPYTLVTTTFKNWRGMQESGGRRTDKKIYIDLTTLEICSDDMVKDLCKAVPVMTKILSDLPVTTDSITNVQLYRMYIEHYLRHHTDVNADLDIIVTQKESTAYGLPIEIYFFIKDKRWAYFERKQSDIFDHLMAIAPEFGLKLYQRP